MIALGVQFFGFLFTAALIFIPTVAVRLANPNGMNQHYVLVATVAGIGASGGFIVSVLAADLPTVPVVVLSTCLMGLMVTLYRRVLYAKKQTSPIDAQFKSLQKSP